MTRARALRRARLAYASLMARAVADQWAPDEYVVGLFNSWDSHLQSLGRTRQREVIPDYAEHRLAFLTREIRRRDLDTDARVRWLDVFPEAVAETLA